VKNRDNLDLTGKVALITGSGRGIGKAIAFKLAAIGARVAVNDLPDAPEAGAAVREIEAGGGAALAVPADVTDSAAVKALIGQIAEKWGGVDILVNNAGIVRESLILRMSEDDWDSVMDTNLRSAYLCSKYALRSMMGRNWGRIINMASVAGLVGRMGRVNYAASKGGLIAFTRSLAVEVGSRNITVNAIAPGFILTRLTDALPPEARETVLSRTALKRPGTPQEVAELAAFLASDSAGYITGQVISIDGGIT
jgi:3-oxoacyl-[acyl-carrier protein] reductase